jgi:hypothetical protein
MCKEEVCKKCGHCPTCGRTIAGPWYPYTYPGAQPYIQPWQSYSVPYWNGTITIQTTPNIHQHTYIDDPPGSVSSSTYTYTSNGDDTKTT